MKKSKTEILKLNLIDVIDEFIISVESANRARKATNSLEDPIEFTFENFMKWLLFKRNKKNIEKLERELNGQESKKQKDPAADQVQQQPRDPVREQMAQPQKPKDPMADYLPQKESAPYPEKESA